MATKKKHTPPPRRPWSPTNALLVVLIVLVAFDLVSRYASVPHPTPTAARRSSATVEKTAPQTPAPVAKTVQPQAPASTPAPAAKVASLASAPVFEDYSHAPSLPPLPSANVPLHVHGLALILDDVGWDLKEVRRALALPYTMAISVMPDAPYAKQAAEMAHAAGHVVMLHMPMEPDSVALQKRMDGSFLRVGMSDAEIHTLLLQALSEVPFVQGMNNHMGSLLTSKAAPMAEVMQVCREKHLFFVDSRTSAASVAAKVAERAGIPWASRQIFLDNQTDEASLQKMWNKALACEQRYGVCIVIAHPHPKTMAFLEQHTGHDKGVTMLAVTHVLHYPGSLASRGN